MRPLCSCLLWLALPIVSVGAEIVGPTTPVSPGQALLLAIRDIPEKDLSPQALDWSPKDGSLLLPIKTWDNAPSILFQPRSPGTQYVIRIGVNEWVREIAEAVTAAERAGVDEALRTSLKQAADKISEAYPSYATSITITTTGDAPDPTTPGPEDPPTPRVIDRVTYVYEKDDTSIPRGVSSGLQRLNATRQVLASVFEDDTVDGQGQVPDQYRIALEAARRSGLPALVVQAGSQVVRVIQAPESEAQVMEAAK